MPCSSSLLSDDHGSAVMRVSSARTPHCDESERWYAVHTQANREASASFHLREQRFKTFLPRCAKNIRHARQVKTVQAPLFPCYLFVALDLRRHRWRSINGTPGVFSLVMQDELPAPVAKGAVEALLDTCDDDAVMRVPALAPGQNVRILSGPFAEQIGVLERLTGPERIRVLLDMMHGQVSVEMARAAIAAN